MTPEPFRVIGNGCKVEWPVELHAFASCNFSALAFGNSVGHIHIESVAKEIRVNGQVRVNVKITKVDVLERISGLNLNCIP